MKRLAAVAVLLALLWAPVHGDPAALKANDGTVLQEVPAGPFWMGLSAERDSRAIETPRHSVTTVRCYLGRTLVTQQQYARFVAATSYRSHGRWTPAEVVGQEQHPVTMVNWDDALAYCTWAGGRLPSEAEWEKAARGTDERLYPWGNDWDPDLCDNSTQGGSRGTLNVATFPDNASASGCLDMAGNVWEWTADWFHAYPGSNAPDDAANLYRALRGGSWLIRDPQSFHSTYRIGRAPDISGDDIGFRLCVDRL